MRAAESDPAVILSKKEAGKGGEITVKGTGWRPEALLMLLICGRSSPERGVIGGTNSCANADGRAVTTDRKGAFSKKLPVAEPPEPCPCVLHVATVTGEQAVVDAVFTVAGHPTAELPPPADEGRLSVLATPHLEGESSLLTWFGAPPVRQLVVTVGNPGPHLWRTPSSRSAPRTASSPRSGRSASGAARSPPAAGPRSGCRSNSPPAPTATTRSPCGTGRSCWPNSRGG